MKLRKELFPIIVGSILILPTLFVVSNNVGRGIFIILSILFWIFLCLYTKKYIFSSILYILFVLPFNITFQLPLTVEIFNTVVLNIQPFVDGIYSNYLIPTISILDIGIVLLLSSFIYIEAFKGLKKLKIPILVLLASFVLLNVYHWDFLVLFTSIRIFLTILSISFLANWLVKHRKGLKWKWIVGLLLFNILFQGILGILQFNGGSSLGLTFLGESQVVNGMQGSSFISLNDGIYLRAYGTFPHPNVLGGYLLMCFTLLWLSLQYLEKYWRYAGYVAIFLCVIFSLFTFSRIAILLMGIGVVLCTLRLGASDFALMSVFVAPRGVMERFLNLLTGGDTSWGDRWNLMLSSFDVIKKNFWFGSGLGRYVKYMEGIVPRTNGGILLIQPVHNVFLLSFAELGLFGFIPLLYWLVEYVRKFVSFKKNVWIKIFVLIIFLVFGMFDHFWWSLPQGLVMSGVLMLLLSIN